MTDTDMLYMSAQSKRIEELEAENKIMKELLREARPVLHIAFFAHYADQNKADVLHDRIAGLLEKEWRGEQ